VAYVYATTEITRQIVWRYASSHGTINHVFKTWHR